MSSTGRIEAGRPPVTCDCDPCPVTTLIIALARATGLPESSIRLAHGIPQECP